MTQVGQGVLALIGGDGKLPGLLIARLEAEGRSYRLCEMRGHSSGATPKDPPIRFRLEHLGTLVKDLRDLGATEICFAGGVRRPEIDPAAIDAATMPLVPRLTAALGAGDDGALRGILSFFEEAGMRVVAAHEILPELMPPAGVLGRVQPGASQVRDAERGDQIIAALAAADVGQACIVKAGQALAVETLGGTEWMIRSLLRPVAAMPGAEGDLWSDPLGHAADWLSGEGAPSGMQRDPALPGGGLLVKRAKPGQDMRVDVPTIGPDTFRLAAALGLEGVVIAAGEVMVLERPVCERIADQHDLLFWVRD